MKGEGAGSCFDKHCWLRLIDVARRVAVTMATDTEALIDTVFPLTATITGPIYLEGSIIEVSSRNQMVLLTRPMSYR